MNGKVLKSNGSYQHISFLKEGDYVINALGRPVKVLKNIKYKLKRKSKIINIHHKHWYEKTLCDTDTNIYVWNENMPQWKSADILANQTNSILVPSSITWDMPDTFSHIIGNIIITTSYDLGYVFGVFLRLGVANKYKGIAFPCTTFVQDRIYKYAEEALKLFPSKVKINDKEALTYFDEDIEEIFNEFFLTSGGKALPLLYRSKDTKYMSGLFDGLVHAHMLQKTPYDKNYIESLYMSSLSINKPIHYGSISRTSDDIPYFSTFSIMQEDVLTEGTFMWNLQVDCPTNSYIINNVIVSSKK
jgi:hypothetical protein